LKQEQFPHLREKKATEESISNTDDSKTELSTPENSTTLLDMAPNDGASLDNEKDLDLEQGKNACDENASQSPSVPPNKEEEVDEIDEDHTYIEIPVPGLHSTLNASRALRQAPNICSICLCNYEVGSDVVWSSNQACDHVFHEQCIEQWLMKQREGPLCPCCRRDFILDPYDLEDDEEVDPELLAFNLMESATFNLMESGELVPETMENPLEATPMEETPRTSPSMNDQRIATMEEQPLATEIEGTAASQILSEAPPPMGDE
jgi:hypothetical protein